MTVLRMRRRLDRSASLIGEGVIIRIKRHSEAWLR